MERLQQSEQPEQSQGQPGQPMPQPGQQQGNAAGQYRMALDAEEAVGQGVLNAAELVRATRRVIRMKTDDRWLTIGGRKSGDKDHAGGFPVKIDADGNILAGGPKGLKGRHISKVGDYFKKVRNSPHAREKRNQSKINKQAKAWEMEPEDYQQVVEQVWKEKSAEHRAREEAKGYARKNLGVDAGKIRKLEDQGFDYASGKIKGLDTLGREMAALYPDLGWGGGYDADSGVDDTDYDARVWELLKEGKTDLPSKDSAEFHEAVDEYLSYVMDQAGGDWSPDDDDSPIPFSLTRMANDEPHEFSSTQFNLPGELAFEVRQIADRIPQDDLSEDGREDNPHITVKFGLHTDDPEDVRQVVQDLPPVAVQFGTASCFHGDEHDVIKIDIESEGLRELNAKLGESLPCTDTHPEYKPHVTIAYVKSGLGEHIAETLNDLEGRVAVFDRLVFSDKSRQWHSIPLTGKATRFSADAPKEGDRKPGSEGELVFSKGHWRKADTKATPFLHQGTHSSLKDFVRDALKHDQASGNLTIPVSPVTDDVASRIKDATGVEAKGFAHYLDSSAFKKILKDHGQEADSRLSVSAEDFDLLPAVFESPDTITASQKTKQGLETITLTKRFNGRIVVVEEVRTKRRLAVKTMYKQLAKKGDNPAHTP